MSFTGILEDFLGLMMKKFFAFTIFTLALSVALFATAGAESAEPATPTDLGPVCAHEHTQTTIYFFDSPTYESINEETHRVSGAAEVETVCLDCGQVVSVRMVDSIEEIRPHSMKNGVCALCGFRHEYRTEAESALVDHAAERTVYARQDVSMKDLETLTISNEELSEIKDSGTSTVLIRGNSGSMAVALEVSEVLEQSEVSAADLYLELAERDDNTVFAGLYLVSASGEKTELTGSGITLRFYQENRPGVRVSVAPSDSDQLMDAEVVWDGRGYWSVQYLEEGTYFILQ